jgi:low affinity Fe/Cu permease
VNAPRSGFEALAERSARLAGSRYAFGIAFAIILVWAASGPIFHFSDTWQLVINTSTTIITFLMVFLIQNTQNRESKALAVKIDELIRAIRPQATP